MKKILNLLAEKRQEIGMCNFYSFLKDNSIDARQRISFAPKVAYFTMSFGDLMTTVLKRANPQTELDIHVNTHCSEDDFHWKWYLEDMENLGYNAEYFENITNIYTKLWDVESASVRHIIYRVIYYGQKCTAPLFHLILIEILEAGLSGFFENTYKYIAKPHLPFLKYFGETHYQAEYNHSVTSWFQVGHEETDKMHPLAKYHLEDDMYELAKEAIDVLFNDFNAMYDCWHQAALKQKFGETILMK